MASESKRKQAAADARYAKLKAEEDAKTAADRAKARAPCKIVYDKTAKKKLQT